MPKVTFKENHDSLWVKAVYADFEFRWSVARYSSRVRAKALPGADPKNFPVVEKAMNKLLAETQAEAKTKTYGEIMKNLVTRFEKTKTIADI